MRSNLSVFRDRFQHAWNRILSNIPEDIRRGKFVDIGCGIGNGVAAAAALGASLAVGVDRSLSEFEHEFAPEEFPQLCDAVGAAHERALLLEGNIFDLRFPPSSFDYAMMLDSAEHVPDPKAFFAWAHAALRPGGYFVVDACPLYYSPVGSHLWPWFPESVVPWVHLRPDFLERCESAGVDSWSMQRARELNRATHDDLRSAFISAGFEVMQEHRSQETPERAALLERVRPELDLSGIRREWLFEDWILLTGRK